MNILNKLFSPKAPKPINFDEGQRFNFSFPKTESQLVRENTHGHIVTLDAAVNRVAAEIASLRETIATGNGARQSTELQASVERARLVIQASTTEHQTYQAKARAGLIQEAAVVPYLQATDDAREVFHKLTDELRVRQDVDCAAVSLAALLAQVQ
jgi:hypothetical protein